MPSRPDRNCGLALAGGSPITTPSVRTRAWAGEPQSRPIGGSDNQIMGGLPPMIWRSNRRDHLRAPYRLKGFDAERDPTQRSLTLSRDRLASTPMQPAMRPIEQPAN